MEKGNIFHIDCYWYGINSFRFDTNYPYASIVTIWIRIWFESHVLNFIKTFPMKIWKTHWTIINECLLGLSLILYKHLLQCLNKILKTRKLCQITWNILRLSVTTRRLISFLHRAPVWWNLTSLQHYDDILTEIKSTQQNRHGMRNLYQ